MTVKGKATHRWLQICGDDRNRTGVQTYPPKAFYMFISALIVGEVPEQNTPILPLAGWS